MGVGDNRFGKEMEMEGKAEERGRRGEKLKKERKEGRRGYDRLVEWKEEKGGSG